MTHLSLLPDSENRGCTTLIIGMTTHGSNHELSLCDSDLCNSANNFQYSIALFIVPLFVIIYNLRSLPISIAN